MSKLIESTFFAQVSQVITEGGGSSQGFVITLLPLFGLILFLLNIVLLIFAIRAIILQGNRWEIPLWSVLCFLFPIVLPLTAIFYFRHRAKTEQKPDSKAS